MKSLPWIAAGIGAGIAAFFFLNQLQNQPAPRYATGSDTAEDVAGNAAAWGSKQRVGGLGNRLSGKLKEGVGRATGDEDLAGEGVLDQAAGAVKDGVGQLAQAAGQTVHDLNF